MTTTPADRRRAIATMATANILQDVADLFGISRERVRQISDKEMPHSRDGLKTGTDPIAIFREIRQPDCRSIAAVANKFHTGAREIQKLLDALGAAMAVERLWRWRHSVALIAPREFLRSNLIESLRRWHREHGQTPGSLEMSPKNGLPWHMTYVRVFGSIRAAQIAAGLRPNALGGAGHRSARTHCLRGHPLTPENIYKQGKSRRCRACSRARARRYYQARKAAIVLPWKYLARTGGESA